MLVEERKLTIRQACKIVDVPRSNFSYVSRPDKDEPVRIELKKLIEKHPAIGFWQNEIQLEPQESLQGVHTHGIKYSKKNEKTSSCKSETGAVATTVYQSSMEY